MSSEEEDERNSISASPLFECPISLQVMSDPVTVCTGLTYDRTSIQNWLRLHHGNNNICPLTGQTLHTRELIPNHTLAALIQKWRLTNPQAEKNKKMLQHMIAQIDKDGASCKIEALRQLKNLARDESNRSHLQSFGILPALIRVIQGFDLVYPAEEEAKAAQEAIAAIVLFSGDDATSCSTDLMSGPAIRTVEWMLAKGDLESRISAADLVEKLAKADDSVAAEIGSMEGVTEGLLALLQHNYALHSALRALVPLCRVVAYRVKIAEAVGVIPLLIRLIAGSERGVIEASMAILEALSTVFQGRCGIMADSVAVTAIVRNLVHVSRVATAHGVGILLNICKNCNKEDEIRELVRSGVVQKLVALLHMKCEPRTKKRINFLIKILSPLDNYESCAQFVIHL